MPQTYPQEGGRRSPKIKLEERRQEDDSLPKAPTFLNVPKLANHMIQGRTAVNCGLS